MRLYYILLVYYIIELSIFYRQILHNIHLLYCVLYSNINTNLLTMLLVQQLSSRCLGDQVLGFITVICQNYVCLLDTLIVVCF